MVTRSIVPYVSRQPAPLTDREADITIDDAYYISLRMLENRLADGEVVVGKKIGVTSALFRKC